MKLIARSGRPPGVTEDEIRRVYRDAGDGVYGYASRMCGGDRALAEDVIQETWMRAVREWRRSGMPERPAAWLRTVARNLVLNELRRRPPVSLDAISPAEILRAADNGLATESADIARLVTRALARLPRGQRRLLESFHYENHNVAEIARASGITERAVEGRLRRARQNLKKHLEAALHAAGGTA